VVDGTVEVAGTGVAWRAVGDGSPVLLIAGTGYPGATWPPEIVEPLAARHTVVTFDHRGTGATPSSPDRYSTRGFAADAAAVIDAVGRGPAHVVGHSMGGRVAQWLALDRPAVVRTLVLAATGPGEFRADRPVTRGIPLHTARDLAELGYERYMADHIARTFFTPEFVLAHPERVEWLVRAFWEHRPSLEEYLRHVVARQEHQTADRVGDLAVPTLVVVGDRDTHVAGTGVHWDASAWLVDHIPGAELAVVEGSAHGYFWQDPEQTVAILLAWTARHP
jgi:pimeloyl-ACP methyl ester carboxylesterase